MARLSTRQVLATAAAGIALGLIAVGAIRLLPMAIAESATPPPVVSLAGQDYRLFDGTLASFDDLDRQGESITVVNFWATWCPPCVQELPALAAVSERFGDRANFVGLAHDEDRSGAQRLAAESGVTYQLGDDSDGAIFKSLGLVLMPSTLLVGPDATVLDVITGPVDEHDLTDRIERALTEMRLPSGS